ncbi:MAG: hypothetical protein NTW86_08710 [Candidatus Sumerlaeota bacterium]|nr:hypothetical protein [Candidatus Sumerlaeota bacterium]
MAQAAPILQPSITTPYALAPGWGKGPRSQLDWWSGGRTNLQDLEDLRTNAVSGKTRYLDMVEVYFNNGDWRKFKTPAWTSATAHTWVMQNGCKWMNIGFRVWPSADDPDWQSKVPDKTWATMPADFGSDLAHDHWWMSPRVPIGWKPGMDAEAGRQLAVQLWQKAADGYFNHMWENVLNAIWTGYFVKYNLQHVQVIWRPFWEASGTFSLGTPHPIYSSSYACAETPGEIAAAKAGQEQCIATIKKVFPTSYVHWCPLKRGQTKQDIRLYSPDNADAIGPDYYDSWPPNLTLADWNKNIMVTVNGGPVGIQKWLDFCKTKNKPLAIGEWGITFPGAGDDPKSFGGDNPLFIQKMFEFFSDNKDWMAYEIYFNSNEHLIQASKPKNPKASAAYRQAYAGVKA